MAERGNSPSDFPSTHWSLVWRAGWEQADDKRAALERLLVRYLPALRAHLLFKGIPSDQADDWLHEFVAEKILEKDLIARADPRCGRFRSFLLTALDRFVSNQARDARAKKRRPEGQIVSLDSTNEPAGKEPHHASAFDVAWAREVIAEALRRMKAACAASGRDTLWEVFRLRVLAPTLEGKSPIAYRQLVEQYGFASPLQLSNTLVTAKRMYARMLREVVAEYTGGEAEVEAELADLSRILSRGA